MKHLSSQKIPKKNVLADNIRKGTYKSKIPSKLSARAELVPTLLTSISIAYSWILTYTLSSE